MARFNVHMEDEGGELHSVTVEAEDHGHAADLALESDETENMTVIDVEEEDE